MRIHILILGFKRVNVSSVNLSLRVLLISLFLRYIRRLEESVFQLPSLTFHRKAIPKCFELLKRRVIPQENVEQKRIRSLENYLSLQQFTHRKKR